MRGSETVAGYKLTRCELELMDVLWTIGQGSVQDVCLRIDRNLAYTTVMTTLNLLASRKKVLRREKSGRAFIYTPLVSREEVSRSVLTELRDVLFGNRFPAVVLNLLAESSESGHDARILREALEKLEGRAP